MKVVSPDIVHKSESGGVQSTCATTTRPGQLLAPSACAPPATDFRGVIVYSLGARRQEVLLGVSRDPQFGPVVVFGLGGIYTEVLRDVPLRVAPLEPRRGGAP